MIPLSATLRVVEPYLPGALVPQRARAWMFGLADRLPAVLSRCLYFETRLADRGGPADLSLAVENDGAEILAGANRRIALPAEFLTNPVWQRIRFFCRQWLVGSVPLRKAVGRIWLEFDTPLRKPRGGDPPPAPGIFIEWRRAAFGGASPEARFQLAAKALAALLDGEALRAAAPLVRSAMTALPAGAYPPYLGVMLQRAGGGIRLCVERFDGRPLLAFLRAIGWPGAHDVLAQLMVDLARVRRGAAFVGPGVTAVDLVSQAAPRVGLEYVFARRPQFRGQLHEERFLDLLVLRGWCDADCRRQLARWPGCTTHVLAHDLWPSVLHRRLNHVKLSVGDDARIEAKAYLALMCFPKLRAARRAPLIDPELYRIEDQRQSHPASYSPAAS
ncbi:MAG TPA: hypothetical protein VF192_04730 [Longimicrobiales bacterium]